MRWLRRWFMKRQINRALDDLEKEVAKEMSLAEYDAALIAKGRNLKVSMPRGQGHPLGFPRSKDELKKRQLERREKRELMERLKNPHQHIDKAQVISDEEWKKGLRDY